MGYEKGQRKEVVATYQYPGRLGRLSKNVSVVLSFAQPECCRFSLSLPSEFQSVVWKDLPSRSVISQSCKVLCRMVSLVVLSSRIPWCIIAF